MELQGWERSDQVISLGHVSRGNFQTFSKNAEQALADVRLGFWREVSVGVIKLAFRMVFTLCH